MGRQYNFAMDETDEKLLMQYLKESGYVVYLERTHRTPETIDEFPVPFSDGWFILYIYHPTFGDMKFESYVSDKKLNIKIIRILRKEKLLRWEPISNQIMDL